MADYTLSNFRNYTIFTDQTGSAIYDSGGATGSYSAGENYYFTIAPQSSTGSLIVAVESASFFSTDKIRIYNGVPTTGKTGSFSYAGSTTNSQLIGIVTGTFGTPIYFTASSGKAYIRFSGDVNGTGGSAAGFRLSWTGSNFYNINTSSGVIYNKYGITFPTDATSGSWMTFAPGKFTSSATLSPDKDFIFGFWAKADLAQASAPASPVIGIGTMNGGQGISIMRITSPSAGDNTLALYYYDASGSISSLSTRGTDILGGGQLSLSTYPPQWNHYGFVIRKTNATTGGQFLAYKDGVLFSSSSITKGTNWAPISTTYDTILGSYRDFTSGQIMSGSTTKAGWSGSLDDIFVATITTGSIPTTYTSFFSNIYNSGNWSDPNTVISNSFSTSLNPRVVLNWRFEETGSLLNTKDYGYYGNFHTASAIGNIANSSVRLTSTSSGISSTPYSTLAYSASILSNATISFNTSSASVYENTASYIFSVQVVTAPVGQSATASIATSSFSETAIIGTNYRLISDGTTISSSTQLPFYLSWSAGDATTKYITASIIDNTTYTGGSSSFNLVIQTASSTNITTTSPSFFTLSILDYEEGYANMGYSYYNIGEASGSVTLYVTRSNGTNGPLSVNYRTLDATAVSGTNYTKTSGTLSWADGTGSTRTIVVPILNDNVYTNPDKYFNVELYGLSTGSYSSYPSAVTSSQVTIYDQDAGTLNWQITSLSTYETASNVSINVLRSSGSYGVITASIQYSSSQGLVTPVSGTIGTVEFASGDTTKQFSFNPSLIFEDLIDEPNDQVYLTFTPISASFGTAKTGSSGTSILTVIDNETGSITFSGSSATIYENTASYYIAVNRLYGGDQAETASITIGGTATSGTQYDIIYNGITQSSPFNITWADQTKDTRYITASIYDNNLLDGNRNIIFGINSSSISSIGPTSSFQLNILDYEITGSARFIENSYSVSIPGTVNVQVERYNGQDVTASAIIDVSSSSTAVAGIDYANIFPYTVNWANQESGSKNITISTLSSWGPSTILNLKFSSLTNLSSGSILTTSVAITSTTISKSSSPYENVSQNYIINDYANLSYQFTRRTQQVPFSLEKKGTGRLRKP